MNFRIPLYVIMLLVVISCSSKKDEKKSGQRAYAEYLTGITLLHHNRMMPRSSDKAILLEQLQSVTSVDADAMIAYLTSIKNRPEKAMELYEAMKQLCSDNTDTVSTIKK